MGTGNVYTRIALHVVIVRHFRVHVSIALLPSGPAHRCVSCVCCRLKLLTKMCRCRRKSKSEFLGSALLLAIVLVLYTACRVLFPLLHVVLLSYRVYSYFWNVLVLCELIIPLWCRKLMYIVQEMVDTERDYVKSLEYIIEVFLNFIPKPFFLVNFHLRKADVYAIM